MVDPINRPSVKLQWQRPEERLMAAKRKTHTAALNAKMDFVAVGENRTVNELASHFGIHPTSIHG